MKLLFIPLVSAISFLPVNDLLKTTAPHNLPGKGAAALTFQDEPGNGKMACIAFKAQDYCRAELPDFDFDARFSVVSATVYFTGANFTGVEKGFITSNSLKPIKKLMARCLPGSRVIFDDVKVKGPDNAIRTIAGINLLLF